ncbi:MAG: tetratricopeptide repeat protein [Bacteroidia bacterium]|nr:tetratricopeptide repeat protein [Bacteroidia bacterium]
MDTIFVGNLLSQAGILEPNLPDSAWSLATRAGKLSRSLNWARGEVNSFRIKGNIANNRSQYSIAEAEFSQGLEIARQAGLKKGIVVLGNNLGTSLQKMGKYPQCLKILTEVYQTAEEIDMPKGMASSCNNLAILYKTQGDLPTARKYYLKSYHINRSIHDLQGGANAAHNYALSFMAEKKTDSLIKWANISLEMAVKGNYEQGIGHARGILAQALFLNGEHAQALKILRQNQELYRKSPDKYSLAGSVLTEGSFLLQMGQHQQGIDKCRLALHMGEEMGSLELQKSACFCIANGEEQRQNYQAALQFARQGQSMEDSLGNLEIRREIGFLQERFQSEQKEKQLLKLSLDLEKEILEGERNEIQLERGKMQRNYLLGALALLLLGIGFLVVKIRGDRKAARLEAEKRTLAEQAVKEKELWVKEIHHRVKNNLQVIYNLLDLQASSLKDPSARDAILQSRDRVSSMALVHKQLYGENTGEKVELSKYIPALVKQIELSNNTPHIQTRVEIAPLPASLDQAIPLGLIVNELVSNSFKYAFEGRENGLILVNLKQTEVNRLELHLSDNGVGFAGKLSENFGLTMVRSLARQLRGTLEISGEDGFSARLNWAPDSFFQTNRT